MVSGLEDARGGLELFPEREETGGEVFQGHAKLRVHRFHGYIQDLCHLAIAQVIFLDQLKNHPAAGRQLLDGALDAGAEFGGNQE